ncbi:hypothetical protein [Kribbella sp. C-35]|uniref:hypothetical protein n=1 Tax=Kribbella sp. C-35 TaxID=2789276 RepID=UPI0039793BA4
MRRTGRPAAPFTSSSKSDSLPVRAPSFSNASARNTDCGSATVSSNESRQFPSSPYAYT